MQLLPMGPLKMRIKLVRSYGCVDDGQVFALTLTLSPGEREWMFCRGKCDDAVANGEDLQLGGRIHTLSRGQRARVRAPRN